MSAATAVATIPQRNSLVAKFASKFSIEPEKLLPILKSTAFKVRDGEATNEQMAALLVVADQYGLNPFTKEIYAFPDKGGIVPVVGVDGWSRIINDHPQSDGFEFIDAEEMTEFAGKQVPIWMDVVIYRKDRSHPIKVRERFDEVRRDTQPWKSHPSRMLRHKVLIQGARVAYGFSGIYDEDEAERIVEREINPAPAGERSASARLKDAVKPAVTETTATNSAPEGAPDADGVIGEINRVMDEAGHSDPHLTVVDACAKLESFNDIELMSLYADELPKEIRQDERFTRAFKKRSTALKDAK